MKKKKRGVMLFSGAALLLGIGYAVFGKNDKVKEIIKYSKEWFDSLSLEQIENEREIVRQEYCKSSEDKADHYYWLLDKFDDVIRHRRYGDDSGPLNLPKREHGWNLAK